MVAVRRNQHRGLTDDVRTWFFDPFDPTQFDALTPLGLRIVVDRVVGDICRDLVPGLDVIRAYPGFSRVPGNTRARIALLSGDLDEATRLAPECDDFVNGAVALFKGDVKTACKHYPSALTLGRRLYGNDYLPDTVEGLFVPLAYFLEGSASRSKQAITLLNRVEQYRWSYTESPYAGWPHLKRLAEPKLAAAPATHPIGFLQQSLVTEWRGETVDPDRRRECAALLTKLGLHLFADEFAPQGGRLRSLRAVRLPWEDQLAQLARAFGAPTTEVAVDARTSRLEWTLGVYEREKPYLEVREQLQRKNGWTTGRRIALDRILRASDTTLPWTDADRALAGALARRSYRNYRGYEEIEFNWPRTATWKALVDHPQIVDHLGAPVCVVGRSASLDVQIVDGGRKLTIAPPLEPGEVHVEGVGTGYVVTSLTPEQAAVARLVGRGMTFPAAAAAAVDALIEGSPGLFRSSAVDGAVHARDPRVHVWMVPKGSSVLAEVGVLPAGEDGPRLEPGRGSPLALGTIAGEAARFKRDLALEQAHLDTVTSLPGINPGVYGSMLDLDTTLAFLAAARDHEIPLRWPEGGELRVRRPGKSVGVALKSAREWFEASGSLVLDDGGSLPLAELLQQLLGTRQRFVRLVDGSFLELESTLRAHLDLLARVGQREGDRIRLHPLAASALSELLDREGVTASAPVRSRIRALHEVPEATPVPPGLLTELRPYQVDGFQWLCGLAALGAGAILADDMGLGKTIVALTLLLHRAKDGPALVVAPMSVAGNWMREAERFAPGLTLHRLRESGDELWEGLGPHDVVVCSYGLLVSRLDALVVPAWSTVIFDESQALKNDTTQRHQAALRVQARFRLALTGTPIENHLGELHAQLSVVLPGMLASRKQFQQRFSTPIESGDLEVRRALKALVNPFLLRRTKQAVLAELPARTDTDVLIELDPAEAVIYEAHREQALAELEQGATAMDVLGQLMRLRQAACSPALVVPGYVGESSKTRAFRRLCRDLHQSGHRALVFSQFVKHLGLLRTVLDDEGLSYAYLDGSTSATERDRLVKQFQTGELAFFLISLRAGGFGLNLTAADYVLHMDPWWNPAVEDQASDRAHRIGQQRPVTVYRLIAKGTVEEQIVALHLRKRDVADQILEGTDAIQRVSAADLLALVQK